MVIQSAPPLSSIFTGQGWTPTHLEEHLYDHGRLDVDHNIEADNDAEDEDDSDAEDEADSDAEDEATLTSPIVDLRGGFRPAAQSDEEEADDAETDQAWDDLVCDYLEDDAMEEGMNTEEELHYMATSWGE